MAPNKLLEKALTMKRILSVITLLSLPLFLTSLSSEAACTVKEGGYEYKFRVNLEEQTYDDAYNDGESLFRVDDYIEVINQNTQEKYVFDLGSLEDDQAGNFNYQAISSEYATYFQLFHDHETWHSGLEGFFSLPSGTVIDLSQVRDCDFNQLHSETAGK